MTLLQERRRSRWIALLAAHFFLFQTVLAAYAMGTGAVGGKVDAFGNVICSAATTSSRHGPHEKSGFFACCTLGCNMASPVLTPPDPASICLRADFVELRPFVPQGVPVPALFPKRTGKPRAPPMAG
jgi:hypothetical protein